MGVTFTTAGLPPERELHLSSANARDLLTWLGYSVEDLWGTLPARELAARCRRRLWPEARNVDVALPPHEEHAPGCARSVFLGRPEGYLRGRTEQLLALAEWAGAGDVSFG
jgi:hypothetical protein